MKSRLLGHVMPGDAIRAKDYNELVDAVDRLQSGGHGSGLSFVQTGGQRNISAKLPGRRAWDSALIGSASGTPVISPLAAIPNTARITAVHSGQALYSAKGFQTSLPSYGLKIPVNGAYLCGFSGQAHLETASPPLGHFVAVGFAVADSDTATVGTQTGVIANATIEGDTFTDPSPVINYYNLALMVPLNLQRDTYLQPFNASGDISIKILHGVLWVQHIGPIWPE